MRVTFEKAVIAVAALLGAAGAISANADAAMSRVNLFMAGGTAMSEP